MSTIIASLGALLGLAIGSFLNVVIWRVPRGESVIHPPSACPQCLTVIKPRDNIPVLSWLLLNGQCGTCQQAISRRYPMVEILTALVFALIGYYVDDYWKLPALWYLAAVSISLAIIDIDVMRLPNQIVLPSYIVSFFLISLHLIAVGHESDIWRVVGGAFICFGLYFSIMLIKPGAMGYGDVKMMGVLGMYLGWSSWSSIYAGLMLGAIIGALVGIATVPVQRWREQRFPYGPSLIAGVWIALVVGDALTQWAFGHSLVG